MPVASTLATGLSLLDRHELAEAEHVLLGVLTARQPDGGTGGRTGSEADRHSNGLDTQTLVLCLRGLADLYLRLGRAVWRTSGGRMGQTNDTLHSRWQWRCLQACGALRCVLRLSVTMPDTTTDNWLSGQHSVATVRLGIIELAVAESLLAPSSDLDALVKLCADVGVTQCDDFDESESLDMDKQTYVSNVETATTNPGSDVDVDPPAPLPFDMDRGIVGLVRDIATDMRGRHLRQRLSEATVRECVMSQLMQLSDVDVLRLLSNVRQKETTLDGVEGTDPEQSSVPSLRKRESPPRKQSPESPVSLSSGPSSHRDTRGVFIWRKHAAVVSPLPVPRPYRLGSFEEVSLLTEYTPASVVQRGAGLWEGAVQVALAQALLRSSELTETGRAIQLCSRALDILKGDGVDTAAVLHRLGVLKCRQGSLQCGAELLRQAVGLYTEMKCWSDCADVWCSLGDAYLVERHGSSALLETVMTMMRVELQSEHRVVIDEDDSDDSGGEEGSYCVQTREALSCYQHALAVLPSAKPPTSILSRVADCHLLAGHHSRAVPCYEAALARAPWCSTALSHTAHVLCMLGSTTLLLGQTSRAVSVLESSVAAQGVGSTRETAFTCALLCAACHRVGREPRSILWGVRACQLLVQLPAPHTALQQWYVAHTLYVLGHCYTFLHLTEKSLQYLTAARLLATDHTWLLVRVLHASGDAHVVAADHQMAVLCYEEALLVAPPGGSERLRLLDALSGAHVAAQQYVAAAACLHEALAEQKELSDGIDGDLLRLLRKLAIAHTLAADVEAAIDCRKDCVAAATDGAGKAADLCSLASLYLVKAFLSDNDESADLQHRVTMCYEDAVADQMVLVHHANALYQRGQDADALLLLLDIVFHGPRAASKRTSPAHSPKHHAVSTRVLYRGVEQAILPAYLHSELDDDSETASLRIATFAPFLALLSCCQLHLVEDAEACLLALYRSVLLSAEPVDHAMLGYALMEMRLYREAAECFEMMLQLDTTNEVAFVNLWFCRCLHAAQTFAHALYRAFRCLRRIRRKAAASLRKKRRLRDSGYWQHEVEMVPPVEVLDGVSGVSQKGERADIGHTSCQSLLLPESKDLLPEDFREDEGSNTPDMCDVSSDGDDDTFVEWTEETVQTPPVIMAVIKCSQSSVDEETFSFDCVQQTIVVNTNSVNCEVFRDETEVKQAIGDEERRTSETQEEWQTMEEIVETPPAILKLLDNQGHFDMWCDSSTASTTRQFNDNDNEAGTRRHGNVEFEPWIDEITVETPTTILNLLNGNGAALTTNGRGQSLGPCHEVVEICVGSSSDEESDGEYWETCETVETPPEILRFMLANQQY